MVNQNITDCGIGIEVELVLVLDGIPKPVQVLLGALRGELGCIAYK